MTITQAYFLAGKFCIYVENINQGVKLWMFLTKLYVSVKSFLKGLTAMLHLGLQVSLFLQIFPTLKRVNSRLFFT
jgi:hypothetical protein